MIIAAENTPFCTLSAASADSLTVSPVKTALPVTIMRPALASCSPAEALIPPLATRSPLVVRMAMSVPLNRPARLRSWLFVSLKPPEVSKPPRVPIWFCALEKSAPAPADPVKIAAATAPPDPSIAPLLDVSDTVWPAALSAPVRLNP